ncbi:MAG: guanylate kinase [Chloroflexi bacterium RBG_16_68_14]|nr:MAG: guanylate kinase [Chloroflexi bacterium RBG_16_68_14]
MGEVGAGPLLVVISGPSGAGKDSVLARLRERGLPAHFTVTATTRPRREVNPSDHAFLTFLSDEEFDRLLAEDGLLEHAQVYGYRYGVPKAPVREALERGQDVVVRVDIQGAATIKRLAPGAVLIFLAPPSREELEARIRARGEDDPETVRRRLEAASRELAELPRFDYVVVNQRDRLDEAADQVLAIMTAERCRVDRQPVRL